MTCTFFGEDCKNKDIIKKLNTILVDMIENKNVTMFYISNHNMFDSIVIKTIKSLCKKYKHINYAVVLSKNPDPNIFSMKLPPHTYMPYNLINYSKHQAEQLQYKWMLDRSDFVVTFVKTNSFAAKYKKIATSLNRHIIELSE